MRRLFQAVLWLRLLGTAHTAAAQGSVGFRMQSVPQPGGRYLPAGFWYPTQSGSALHAVGLTEQPVAPNAPVAGDRLPLIVMSPGTMGSWNENADLAIALARAGFVVANMTCDEFGPDWILKPADRTLQLHGLVDFALHLWAGRSHIDQARIGAFGFSLGGFTVLVALGGKPDVRRMPPHCRVAPNEWSCMMQRQRHLDMVRQNVPASAWVADARIRSAVLAAPALGYIFGKPGLAAVHVPIQLWRAGKDSVLAEPWNAEAVAQDLPSPPDMHVVNGADHGDFSGLCSAQAKRADPGLCTGKSGFDRDAFHARFNPAVVHFFKTTLAASR